MRFLVRLIASVYGPAFYASMPRWSGGGALLYFLALTLILTLVRAIPVLPAAFALQAEAPRWLDTALGYYPDELQVSIAGGRASTNAREPYVIPLPQGSGPPANLLVIDTATPFSAEQLRRYDTAVWLTRDSLIMRDDQQSQLRVIDLAQVPDVTVDKQLVRGLGDYVAPWLRLVGPAIAVAAIVGLSMLYLLRLLWLVLLALPILLVARLLGQPWSYGVAYKAGLYAMTLGLVVETLAATTGAATGFGGFPFMLSLITLAVVAANLAAARGRAAPEAGRATIVSGAPNPVT